MNDAKTIQTIIQHAEAIKAQGATALYVYGSRARGDNTAESDLDIFVEYDPHKIFSLMNIAGIKLLIEDKLGLDVHITTHDSLHPLLKDDIEQEAIRVF